MSIAAYLKEIGRGRKGSRSLDRGQATDLFGQILDGNVSDLEIGAFCVAMRIKGETPEEMAGFLDATHVRSQHVCSEGGPVVVLPSYNGARKLPALTALLALALASAGLPVLLHGRKTESSRVSIDGMLASLAIFELSPASSIASGEVRYADAGQLLPGLARLLDVRRVLGLRNSAHSVVKLWNPCNGNSLVVPSYTHPEYAVSMAHTLQMLRANALLLRGTEGEPVADPRRVPAMEGFVAGQQRTLEVNQPGPLPTTGDLPEAIDVISTCTYIRAVLEGELAMPISIARQIEHILRLCDQIRSLPP